MKKTGKKIDAVRKRIVRGEGVPALDSLGEDGLGEAIEQGLQSAGAEAATALLCRARPTDQGQAAESVSWTDRDRFVIEARGEVDPRLYRGLLRAPGMVLLPVRL